MPSRSYIGLISSGAEGQVFTRYEQAVSSNTNPVVAISAILRTLRICSGNLTFAATGTRLR